MKNIFISVFALLFFFDCKKSVENKSEDFYTKC